jgi:hypothetical protein
MQHGHDNQTDLHADLLGHDAVLKPSAAKCAGRAPKKRHDFCTHAQPMQAPRANMQTHTCTHCRGSPAASLHNKRTLCRCVAHDGQRRCGTASSCRDHRELKSSLALDLDMLQSLRVDWAAAESTASGVERRCFDTPASLDPSDQQNR